MAFTTLQEWREMANRVAHRDIVIERLVRAFFADLVVVKAPDLDDGDVTVTTRPLTNAEKNAIRAKVADLCNANSNDYLSAIAP